MPLAALGLSVYSALFATVVLYPWHVELSEGFKTLELAVSHQSCAIGLTAPNDV